MHPDFNKPTSLLRRYILPAVAAVLASPAVKASSLVGDSPFALVGSAALAGAVGPAEAYELEGSSAQGADVSVCIFERQKKHSYWIPVGGESEGIHVVSFDRAMDSAVVTIMGARKQLTMRTSKVASTATTAMERTASVVPTYSPPPAPVAGAPVQPGLPLTTAAQQQREARMLVSDLLEIGVQQRKAYQEARQRAASGTQPPPEN